MINGWYNRRHQDCEDKKDGSEGGPWMVCTEPAFEAGPELGERSPLSGTKAAAAEDVIMALVIMIVPNHFSRLLDRGL